MKCPKFVETVRVFLAGGNGGNGCVSFRTEKFVPLGGPNGGNGGNGGDIILQSDRNITSLIDMSYRPHRQAWNGGNGKGNKLHGRNGKDLVLKVPCGTEVWNDSGNTLLIDLVEEADSLIVARGGKGGQGNGSWKRGSSRDIDASFPGEPGESQTIRLELKMVVDIALIGLPNAGKSSLLSVISNAHPKIAAYPFTTLNPVIGTIQDVGFDDLIVIDTPGLAKDAHRGVGLGHKFLRHVERARFLVLVIDMAGSDGNNPESDYYALLNELSIYDESLVKKPFMLVGNKMDMLGAQHNFEEFKRITGQTLLPVSASTLDGIEECKRAIYTAIANFE